MKKPDWAPENGLVTEFACYHVSTALQASLQMKPSTYLPAFLMHIELGTQMVPALKILIQYVHPLNGTN